MKKIALGLVGLVAFAANAQQEVGRVISSTPVIQQVAVPRQVCNAPQPVQRQSSGGGALIGAVVGGLLGNTIGHGGGRAAATGVGVIAGAAVGDRIEGQGQPQVAQQCYTQTYYENRTVGYNVMYEYAGRQYNTQLPYDPGQSIQLQVTPVGAGSYPPPSAAQPGGPAPFVTAPPISYMPLDAGLVIAPAAYMAPVVYPRPYPISFGFGYVHRHHR